MSLDRRRSRIEPAHPRLSISRQCRLLSIARSSYYRAPAGESEANLALMRQIDTQFLETPWYGSRQMARHLRRQGWRVGRHCIRRLMRKMGLVAIYQKPRTSLPHPEHQVSPYLLRGLAIERANQVWCADVTYIPMRRGFLYLVAIMDWASRKVLAWRLSNSLDAEFCIAALEEALARYGRPEIFNTDQGSQFTSLAFTHVLKAAGVRISMDGPGRWMDNVFIERLWRSLKYECIYLQAFETGSEARVGIGHWIGYYNADRPHSALGGLTPGEAYARPASPSGPGQVSEARLTA
jgi:putative transposase